MSSKKIDDTGYIEVSRGGRLDQHWRKNGIRDFAKAGKQRLNLQLNPVDLATKFGLKGFEFGRWTTNEDRHNFLNQFNLSVTTMCKALKLSQSTIGLKLSVGVAYGARGSGSALAHYEPGTGMINLTRYQRTSEITKPSEFTNSGGIGSFAHEWGHALDYYLGTYVDQSRESRALTYGPMVIKTKTGWSVYDRLTFPKDSPRYIAREILASIMWHKRGQKFSPYYRKLLLQVERNPLMGDYWLRCNELFARAFEQYVSKKITGMGVRKNVLVHGKYWKEGFSVYLSPEQLAKVTPLFDKLISKVRG